MKVYACVNINLAHSSQCMRSATLLRRDTKDVLWARKHVMIAPRTKKEEEKKSRHTRKLRDSLPLLRAMGREAKIHHITLRTIVITLSRYLMCVSAWHHAKVRLNTNVHSVFCRIYSSSILKIINARTCCLKEKNSYHTHSRSDEMWRNCVLWKMKFN